MKCCFCFLQKEHWDFFPPSKLGLSWSHCAHVPRKSTSRASLSLMYSFALANTLSLCSLVISRSFWIFIAAWLSCKKQYCPSPEDDEIETSQLNTQPYRQWNSTSQPSRFWNLNISNVRELIFSVHKQKFSSIQTSKIRKSSVIRQPKPNNSSNIRLPAKIKCKFIAMLFKSYCCAQFSVHRASSGTRATRSCPTQNLELSSMWWRKQCLEGLHLSS